MTGPTDLTCPTGPIDGTSRAVERRRIVRNFTVLVSYTWLKELVPITISPEELAHRLTMAGLEVAGITRIGDDLENVVVAQIEELSPHPNADRLSLCQVNDGTKMLSIVCGASNMKAGDKVALAPIGTKLPNGVKIKASKIRGVNSEGMLCSEEELNLEKESTGIMILPPEARIGALVATELGLKDFVLDVDLTPNRADCLSMVGIAREVGALLDLPVSLPSANLQVDEQGDPVEQHIRVVVDAPDLCPRYAARYVSGVTIKPSPLWLRQRLERAGIRAINNVVDITNYILLTWGQPMHAFDYSLLDQGMIRVRRAAAHDRFFTLDEKERLLDDQTLMICDASKYVAIGGIMGGLNTEIAESTQTVLLESAYFTPHGIRRTSRFLGLQTESSARFEKGVDPEAVIPALNHAAQLIAELAGGIVARGVLDVYPQAIPDPPAIELKLDKVPVVLGVNIAPDQMIGCLKRLHISVTRHDQTILATAPSWRGDLKEDVDLIEEIARLHGYENIPVTLPEMDAFQYQERRLFDKQQKLRLLLTNSGFFEVITYSFISPKNVEALMLPDHHLLGHSLSIANPLSQDQSVMRTTLLPGLLLTARNNCNRGTMDLKLFEIGTVFHPKAEGSLPDERLMLSALLCGRRSPESWNTRDKDVDFYDIKGVLENIFHHFALDKVRFVASSSMPMLHPGIAASIEIQGEPVGIIGEVHPHVADNFEIPKKIVVFEVDFGKIMNYCTVQEKHLKPLPKFPAVYRDIALIADTTLESQTVQDAITGAHARYLEEVRVFDLYQGENIPSGKKSLAFRLKFQAPDRSLTDEEVNRYHNHIVDHLMNSLTLELRT